MTRSDLRRARHSSIGQLGRFSSGDASFDDLDSVLPGVGDITACAVVCRYAYSRLEAGGNNVAHAAFRFLASPRLAGASQRLAKAKLGGGPI